MLGGNRGLCDGETMVRGKLASSRLCQGKAQAGKSWVGGYLKMPGSFPRPQAESWDESILKTSQIFTLRAYFAGKLWEPATSGLERVSRTSPNQLSVGFLFSSVLGCWLWVVSDRAWGSSGRPQGTAERTPDAQE